MIHVSIEGWRRKRKFWNSTARVHEKDAVTSEESEKFLDFCRILGFLSSSDDKKGVCLARCTGELHPGPSGWIYRNSEVLEVLTF